MILNETLLRNKSPLGSLIQFFSRIFRVLTLDRKVFIEIYADPRATLQSFILVLLASISVYVCLEGIGVLKGFGLVQLLLYGSVVWIVDAILAFIIGRFVLPMPGTGLTPPSVARAITYAQAPSLLIIFGLIPMLNAAVVTTVLIWEIVTTTLAFKHAFRWSLRRAIAGMILYSAAGTLILWNYPISF